MNKQEAVQINNHYRNITIVHFDDNLTKIIDYIDFVWSLYI